MAASATLVGDWVGGTTENAIVRGHTDLIVVLVSDTFVDGTTFLDARQDFIDGFDSNLNENGGWNTQIRDKLSVASVTRTSDVSARISFLGASGYDITATETITNTIPGSVLTSGSPITNTTTIAVTIASGGTSLVNSDSTTDVPVNYEISQRNGFKYPKGTLIRDGYTGIYVAPEHYDAMHPQDRLRSRPETQRGSPAPELEDNFLTANEVSVSDL